MPQTSVQQKLPKGQKCKGKRKRTASEVSDFSETNYPPKKMAAIATDNTSPETCTITSPPSAPCTPQPATPDLKVYEPETWSDLRVATCFLTPSASHNDNKQSPFPTFDWADGTQVWSLMCLSDQRSITQRDPQMFQRHPSLQPRMRAILLDWLMEVCEVYKLHRETYYLAMDYVDRYLSTHHNVPKHQLQLIGITCLFIASKVEEIYPPKITEYAYVTDDTCTEQEILKKELVIIKGLGWTLSSLTPPNWLNVFMQIELADPSNPNTFIYPQYGGVQYAQASLLLDLATLDEGSLKFSYSHLAAAALYHTHGREAALRASKLSWEQLAPCARWLSAFASTVQEKKDDLVLRSKIPDVDNPSTSGLRSLVPNLKIDEAYRIQPHAVTLDMLEQAQQRLLIDVNYDSALNLDSASSPDRSGILTPPSSSHKAMSTPPRRPDPLESPYT